MGNKHSITATVQPNEEKSGNNYYQNYNFDTYWFRKSNLWVFFPQIYSYACKGENKCPSIGSLLKVDWIVSLQNPYGKVLTPTMMVFRDGAFGRYSGIDWGPYNEIRAFKRNTRELSPTPLSLPCKHTVRRPPENLDKSPQQNLTMLAPWSQNFLPS